MLYKSGNKHTVRGLIEFNIKSGTWSWETGGPNKPLLWGIDNVEAVFYVTNPWYRNLAYAIWRKLP